MTKVITEQILNLQKMVEDECSRRCELERKLAIATKALKEMIGYPPTNFHDCETYMWTALQALKEMEGVK